jgi:hypothetical protein
MRRHKSILLVISFSAILSIVSSTPSSAAGSIGTLSAVATGANSTLAWSGGQGSLDLSIVYATANPGFVYRSVDSGTSWSPVTALGNKKWTAVAVNDTGTVVAAVSTGDYVYISTDSGTTWNAATSIGTANWADVDLNASGSTILVTTSTVVKVSTDFGSTWQSYTPGGSGNVGVAVSAAGDKMAVVSYNGSLASTSLYLSSNTGATWTGQSTPGGNDYINPHIWMSRDGQKIVFSRFGSYIFNYTSNFGTTWSTLTPAFNSRAYGSMAFTDDMTKMWVTDSNGTGSYSLNSGSNWTSYSTSYYFKTTLVSSLGTRWIGLSSAINTGIFTSDTNPGNLIKRNVYDGYSQWSRTEVSADGQTVVAGSYYGELAVSPDGGSTWRYSNALGYPSNGVWNCIAVSGDGNVIYAANYGSAVYKSSDKGLTWSAISGGALTSGNKYTLGCATNYDGSKFAISIYLSGLLYSTNGGSTFALKLSETVNGVTYGYGPVTFSDDGNRFAVAARYGATKPIFLSSDGGSTWETSTVTSSTWGDLVSSSNSTKLIAVANNTDAPQISLDWGRTWSAMNGIGTTFKYGISMNSDGSVIVAGTSLYNGSIYYSTNNGATFSQFSGLTAGTYSAVRINQSGTQVYVGLDYARFAIGTISVVTRVTFSSITIPSAFATYRSNIVLTATLGTVGGDGKVTFYANGKKISGCIKKSSSGLAATCTWKPSLRGAVQISASVVPTDSSLLTSYSQPYSILVTNRSTRR